MFKLGHSIYVNLGFVAVKSAGALEERTQIQETIGQLQLAGEGRPVIETQFCIVHRCQLGKKCASQ